ncbi:MAG: antitoxin [Bacteroidetes bacterium RIFCSPLOWO2_02_FULL_36_8]|nr:MAG: antitoxin [Bacteroidetes bacterium RIFCSPLOWO2_02_FULL_36_8]OFY69708.1 MAG: antitoxin [Bacteroidetes bacterium RIFCSPLOWO2_12_FULL_37_12]
MLGKPVIKGTRITVELILRKLSEGAKISDILIMYNHIKEEDVLAALTYASDVVSKEEMLSITK